MPEFTFPLPPNVANARGHRYKQYRERQEWAWRAVAELTNHRRPKQPWDRAEIQCAFFLRNVMDADNLAARCKPILDVLKGWYFVDDSPKHLVFQPPTQAIDRKKPRVVVTLRELTEAQ